MRIQNPIKASTTYIYNNPAQIKYKYHTMNDYIIKYV